MMKTTTKKLTFEDRKALFEKCKKKGLPKSYVLELKKHQKLAKKLEKLI